MRPVLASGKSFCKSRAVSKALWRCPARERDFSHFQMLKNRRCQAVFPKRCEQPPIAAVSEPPGLLAHVVHAPVLAKVGTVQATLSALHPVMAPGAAAEPAEMGQDRKPALLAVVERLVERVGGVGELLHRVRCGGHGLGM